MRKSVVWGLHSVPQVVGKAAPFGSNRRENYGVDRVSPHGQGQETTFAQMIADEFGVDIDDVVVIHGDTGRQPYGIGTLVVGDGCRWNRDGYRCRSGEREDGKVCSASDGSQPPMTLSLETTDLRRRFTGSSG